MSQINAGEKVLLIATPSLHTNDEMISARQQLVDTVGPNGAVGFEVFDRVEEAPITTSSYTRILSTQTPNIHTPTTFQKFLTILQPGGTLHFLEPALLSTASSVPGSQMTRTKSDLLSAVKLAGFVDAAVVGETIATDEVVQYHAAIWGIPNSFVPYLKGGKIALIEVVANKPQYEIGQRFALSFARKAGTNGTSAAAAKKVGLGSFASGR